MPATSTPLEKMDIPFTERLCTTLSNAVRFDRSDQKKPEFTCSCCLSAGCASNKQQSISLRYRKIRPAVSEKGNEQPNLLFDLRRHGRIWKWWSRTGSNRRPEACKATALPTELRPQKSKRMVGPGRLELPTSRLSGVRSNQLSYGPSGSRQRTGLLGRRTPGVKPLR